MGTSYFLMTGKDLRKKYRTGKIIPLETFKKLLPKYSADKDKADKGPMGIFKVFHAKKGKGKMLYLKD